MSISVIDYMPRRYSRHIIVHDTLKLNNRFKNSFFFLNFITFDFVFFNFKF